MNKLLFAAFVLVLAGCASPGDLRMKSPVYDQSVNAQPEQLAGCISDQLESMFKRSVSARPTANGYSVTSDTSVGVWSLGGKKDTVVVIDIIKSGDKSRVQFFSNLAFDSGNDRVVAYIKNCVGNKVALGG